MGPLLGAGPQEHRSLRHLPVRQDQARLPFSHATGK